MNIRKIKKILMPHKQKLAIATVIIVVTLVLGASTNYDQQTTHNNKTTATNLNRQLQRTWSKVDTDDIQNAQIAVYDKKTGKVYKFTHGSKNKYPTASIIKVFILTYKMSLGELTDDDKILATQMIEDSDNDATTEMTVSLGGIYQFPKLFQKLDMKNSNINQTWGLTQTTATDQLKLLNELFYRHKIISQSDSNYIINLMNHVNEDQDWGISTGVSDDTVVELKNGWLPLNDNYQNAIVNSIGHVKNDNVNYTIAILSNGGHTQDAGIDYVNALSRATYKTLSK